MLEWTRDGSCRVWRSSNRSSITTSFGEDLIQEMELSRIDHPRALENGTEKE